VLMSALILFIFSLWITRFIGKEFKPGEDQSQFIIRMEAPIDYSVEQVEKYFRPAEKMVRDIPEIKSVFYVQGYQGYANRGIMIVGLIPKADREKSQEYIKKIGHLPAGFAAPQKRLAILARHGGGDGRARARHDFGLGEAGFHGGLFVAFRVLASTSPHFPKDSRGSRDFSSIPI